MVVRRELFDTPVVRSIFERTSGKEIRLYTGCPKKTLRKVFLAKAVRFFPKPFLNSKLIVYTDHLKEFSSLRRTYSKKVTGPSIIAKRLVRKCYLSSKKFLKIFFLYILETVLVSGLAL